MVGAIKTHHHLNAREDIRWLTRLSRGFSYGSVLGAAFSSIFPGRVERVILDGKQYGSSLLGRVAYST